MTQNSDFFQVRFDTQRLHTCQLQKIERVIIKGKGGRIEAGLFFSLSVCGMLGNKKNKEEISTLFDIIIGFIQCFYTLISFKVPQSAADF